MRTPTGTGCVWLAEDPGSRQGLAPVKIMRKEEKQFFLIFLKWLLAHRQHGSFFDSLPAQPICKDGFGSLAVLWQRWLAVAGKGLRNLGSAHARPARKCKITVCHIVPITVQALKPLSLAAHNFFFEAASPHLRRRALFEFP